MGHSFPDQRPGREIFFKQFRPILVGGVGRLTPPPQEGGGSGWEVFEEKKGAG